MPTFEELAQQAHIEWLPVDSVGEPGVLMPCLAHKPALIFLIMVEIDTDNFNILIAGALALEVNLW